MGMLLGFFGSLCFHYKVVVEADEEAKTAKKAAGQMSDVIRYWTETHPEQADSIFDCVKAFSGTENPEEYLHKYICGY